MGLRMRRHHLVCAAQAGSWIKIFAGPLAFAFALANAFLSDSCRLLRRLSLLFRCSHLLAYGFFVFVLPGVRPNPKGAISYPIMRFPVVVYSVRAYDSVLRRMDG